ncbi:LuxR C-terminal-related transcriptional regulator [Streptomyces sp. NPDC002577]
MAVDNDVPANRHDLHPAVRRVLKQVSTIMNEPSLAPGRGTLDVRRADAALNAAEHLLARQLAGFQGSSGTESQLAAVLIEVQAVRSLVNEAELGRRSAAVKDVRAALQRLRSVGTVAELVEQAPIEINRLGYRRALLSRLQGADWAARAAFAHEDAWLAVELVRIGSASPGRLGRELPETELVRHRIPVLVRDAQSNPRVHRELITLARTKDYIAAPLIARGEVVGLIHADQHVETGTVRSFDRELLGLFAEGLGFAFERAFCHEQLSALRSRLEDQARSVGDLIESSLGPDALALGVPPESPSVASATVPWPRLLHALEWPLTELTRREVEVLQHLADGESNAQIAAKLYVSVETVKTHVKNLLRKLGAANRAEAVALVRELASRSPQ